MRGEIKMKDQLEILINKDQIRETIDQLFIATDNREWQKVKQCFTDSVKFDMTSMTGGDPAIIKSDEIINGWEAALKKLEAIHHQAGNYLIEVNNDESTVFCYAIASHYLSTSSGNNTRTFVGSYNFHLMKKDNHWRIDQFKFNLKYSSGNMDLEAG